MNTQRLISAADAAREALDQLLAESKDYFVIGEGVPDPKACFGTTKGLKEKYPDQVFDMPISENGVTGVCVGAAVGGMKPIMIHMRQDFLLYAMDQIVNNAAKWHSMFGGQAGSCPMVIKAFTGKGWGAGHQHAQNLEAIFAHIPGLKVCAPSSALNAKGLLIAAARDPNPVLILEHRWIHNTFSEVPEEMFETEKKAVVVREGTDGTIVTWGYSVIEARRACEMLAKFGISIEIIDLQWLRPLDTATIFQSVKRTGRLFVVAEAWKAGSLASEIIADMAERDIDFKSKPLRITNPSYYPSSTPALTKNYYPNYMRIFDDIGILFGIRVKHPEQKNHDIPDASFKGPF